MTFASSDETVATVDAYGVVTIVAETFDTCVITATSVNESKTCELVVVSDSAYEVITGLSLASGTVTPQVVYLEVDADKTCYVVLPDGSVLTSTTGIINTTWAGAAGAVTLIVQKNTTNLSMDASDFIGILSINLVSIGAPYCTKLTGTSAPNATIIDASDCTSLTTLSAPNATAIYASGCALTDVSIAALFAELVATGNEDGTLDISGGTSAVYTSWSGQAHSDKEALETRGWTLTYTDL